MSREEFEKFRHLVLQDSLLQEELRGFVERAEFVNRVVELGMSHGFEFTADDVEDAIKVNRRAWIERWI